MSLNHDKVESHVSPGKISKLKLVVSGLQRSNEKDEA
jgi:hypothetical protein